MSLPNIIVSGVFYTICPNCKAKTEYVTNPMYIHVCQTCDHTCGESDLITKINIDIADTIIERAQDLIDKLEDLKADEECI